METTEAKLNVELKNLETFKEILVQSNEQTKVMSGILSHFQERLSKLEETIGPVYKKTGNLQTRQENIVKTLESLDYVVKFYTVSSEVEQVIRAGPSQSSLRNFILSLDKLKEALDYFEHNNPESPELMNVSALYEKGGNLIEKEFKQLLARYSNPLPPTLIYDLVHEETCVEAEQTILSQFTEKTKQELAVWSEWLSSNRTVDFTSAYASVRSEVFVRSLQALRDHQKSTSGGFAGPPHGSPLVSRKSMLGVVKDTPPQHKRTPKTIQQALKKKLQDVISAEMLGGKSSHPSMSDIRDEPLISEKEVVSYLTCVSATYKLAQCELKLMDGIVPRSLQKPVFSRLVLPALDIIVGEGESIANRVKKCTARHDFISALNLFPLLRYQANMRHNFDILFDGCSPEVQSKFQGLVVTLQTTINRTLEDFIDYIKTNADMKVPRDGTVHELASNTMIFVANLLDHMDILSRVISITDFHSREGVGDKNRWAYAQYIARVLSSLGLTLQNKSEAYSDPYLKAIFLLNNFHYILQTLQKSSLLEIVHIYDSGIEEVYQKKIKENKRIYSQSWGRVLHYLLDADRSTLPRSGSDMPPLANMKLKDKDRRMIKDKFAGFNKEIEEIRKTQRAYAVPSPELRESLKRDNVGLIVPKYQIFYQRYTNMNFAKNMDKYVKYTPNDVRVIIESFFDSAA